LILPIRSQELVVTWANQLDEKLVALKELAIGA